MSVEVDNRTPERVDEPALAALVEHVIDACGLGDAEAAVLLVDAAEMRELNREYRAVDAETDVLAFPIDEADELPLGLPRLLGDVVICLPVAARQAAEHDVERGVELATLAVHGTLHLAGLDHERDDGEMLRRQHELVARVGTVPWPAS
jgi:probable rRNA maturation factor